MFFFTELGPVEFSEGAVDLGCDGNAAVETTVWPQITGGIVLCTRWSYRKGANGHSTIKHDRRSREQECP